MKFAILSDTHILDKNIPLCFAKPFAKICSHENFDAIIHCGDYTNFALISFLEDFAPFHGVYGNMDDYPIMQNLPHTKAFSANETHFGIMHGWDSPNLLSERIVTTMRRIHPNFAFNVVFHGHSHIACDKFIGDIRVINPGSVSQLDAFRGTFAIFEFDGTKQQLRFVSLEL